MKIFENPEIVVTVFEVDDVMTESAATPAIVMDDDMTYKG